MASRSRSSTHNNTSDNNQPALPIEPQHDYHLFCQSQPFPQHLPEWQQLDRYQLLLYHKFHRSTATPFVLADHWLRLINEVVMCISKLNLIQTWPRTSTKFKLIAYSDTQRRTASSCSSPNDVAPRVVLRRDRRQYRESASTIGITSSAKRFGTRTFGSSTAQSSQPEEKNMALRQKRISQRILR